MTVAVSSHPLPEKLRDFGLGRLLPPESEAIAQHVAVCNACTTALQKLQDDSLVALLRCPESSAHPGELAISPAVLPPLERDTAPQTQPVTISNGENEAVSPASVVVPPTFWQHPRYRILRRLGQGGMGEVYLAEHKRMERLVALKVIRPELLTESSVLDRFLQEVKAVARLAHPNIVQAFDADEAGDLHFLVLEYVPGECLADYLKRHERLPIGEACEYIRQTALGLQHAHERGMTHRDVKPHNLMLTPEGHIKILDFGLALLTNAEDDGTCLTSPGVTMGTADYIAPEQADDSHRADIRCDIYSLGCSLYHLLAGRTPFPKGTSLQKILKHTLEEPTPLQDFSPEIPDALAALVKKMMAKNPADRYPTPADAAAELAPFASPASPGVLSMQVDSTPEKTKTLATEQYEEKALCAANAASLPTQKRLWWYLVGVAVTAVAVLAVWLTVSHLVFRIDTPHGEIVLKTNDPHLEITIRKNGEIVSILDTKTKQSWRLDTKKLSIGLADEPNGLTIDLDGKTPLVLKRNGKGVMQVTWLPAQPRAGTAENALTEIRRFAGHENGVLQVALSPDGKWALSGGRDWVVRLWDVATAKEVKSFKGHTAQIYTVAFSPNGKQILSGGDDVVLRLWDLESGKEVRRFSGHKATVTDAVFSPDGQMFASSSFDGSVRLWDVKTGKEMRTFLGHKSMVQAVAFSPDGKRVITAGGNWDHVAENDFRLRLWDVRTGKEIRSMSGHCGLVRSAAFSTDGKKVLSASLDGSVRLWDVKTGRELQKMQGSFKGMHTAVFSVAGDYVLAADIDGTLRWFDVRTGKELASGVGHSRTATSVAICPDGRHVLSASMDTTLRLWRIPAVFYPAKNTTAPLVIREIRRFGPKGATGVDGIAFSTDNKRAVAAVGDGVISLWDINTGKEVKHFEGHTGGCWHAHISNDGKRIISGGVDGTVRLWAVATGKELRRLSKTTGRIRSVYFSKDANRALICGATTVHIWNLNSNKEERVFKGHSAYTHWAVFSPDEKQVLTTDDFCVRLWDVQTGKVLRVYRPHQHWVAAVAFSPDGKRFASCGHDAKVCICDVETGEVLHRLHASQGPPVEAVAWTPDGRHVASAGQDGRLCVWDVTSGALVGQAVSNTGRLMSVAVSSDGKYVIGGGHWGIIRLWALPNFAK